MAVTVLDEKTALVLIDLQKGIVALPVAHSAAEVVSRASRLAAAFRRAGKPVALVNVAGGAPGRTDRAAPALPRTSDWTELVAELAAEPSDLRVTKHAWGAFTGTDLHAKLKALGVTQIVLAGIATSIGVESTAREAFALGYNVTLAIDAMTDMSREAHDNSLERIFPRLGEACTSQQVIDLLQTAHG